ncbi:MAG: peptidylprolyl isomerase [Candidatus Omnitrophica bacterium]|nr:peptidylprolyl isomerase [Candidatus Omnitrophota bacterium]
MRKIIYCVIVTSLCVLQFGCGGKGEKVIAKIGNRAITLEEFNNRINSLPRHYQDMIKGQKKEFLDDLIIEELLYQEALRSEVGNDTETQAVIEEAKKKILISRFIKERVDSQVNISEDDIEKYYNDHSEDFMLPERWRASHILVETEEEAREIKGKLMDGANFEELARSRSIDASAQNGGDLGYFQKGQLIPDFEQECLKLDIGETSDVIHSKLGYHIIKLVDKKNPEVQEFESVETLIKKELERAIKKQILEDLTSNLKQKTDITVNDYLLEDSRAGNEQDPIEDTSGEAK